MLRKKHDKKGIQTHCEETRKRVHVGGVYMIHVGFIGPKWMEVIMKDCFSRFPSIQVTYRFSDNIFDAIHFTKELEEQIDCFLYSSRATYLLVKENGFMMKECYYIPLKGNGFYKAIYALSQQTNLKKVSLDGIPEAYIDKLEGIEVILVSQNSSVPEIDEIVALHIANVEGNQQAGVITSLRLVAEKLQAQQIPVEWLKPTKEDIIVCLERLMLTTKKRTDWESQVILGKLQINLTAEQPLPNLGKLEKSIKIDKLVTKFVDEINGYIFSNNALEYVFVSHRGEFERVTEGYKILRLFTDIQKVHPCTFQMGIGFGWTIQLANYHAEIAFSQSIQYSPSCAFIINEARKAIGPIDLQSPITYDLGMHAMAPKNKQLEIIKSYLYKNKIEFFTANEVASILHLTKRTANRLIVKWMDQGIVEPIGVEYISQKGRPRQRYCLKELVK